MADKNKKGTESPKQQDGEVPEQSDKVHLQAGSLFFQRLPQEIRDHIWTWVFCSTRFTFRAPLYDRCPFSESNFQPPTDRLALLRTCRRARLEIGDSWLRHVQFCFRNIAAMLDNLSALPVATLSKLRQMRVSGDVLMINPSFNPNPLCLDSALKLLPGLQLDQLTVLSGHENRRHYDGLSRLIKHSNGWKTLRYISFSSAARLKVFDMSRIPNFTSSPPPEVNMMPQPKHWQAVMEGRDGVSSNPSVTVCRAKERPARYGPAILGPSRGVKSDQNPYLANEDSRPDLFPVDAPQLMTGDEQMKELMVIVKRGSGVDYEGKKDSPLIEDHTLRYPPFHVEYDFRSVFPDMTWEEIQQLCSVNRFGFDDGNDHAEGVDEYVWTPPDPNLDL
ncbi:hypothetical protein B0H63DRAFT_401559 [Podospora didyma]|uniref:2EXR domain-containing protein n=1 Tax=Podospora didyma TaxID=330526 RepID=A0AAE0N5T8_9PEZI|nr:hypothetical protein B0H63DRAFT_401559 [Podospora didyma]